MGKFFCMVLAFVAVGCAGQTSTFTPDDAGPPPVEPLRSPPYNPQELPGASVEGAPGSGLDLCFTRSPGVIELIPTDGGAPEGQNFMRFRDGPCNERASCQSTHASSAQLYFQLPQPKSVDAGASLHFDASNLGPNPPSGTVSLYSVDAACASESLLVSAPLADLHLESRWRTACVTLPAARIGAIGLAVTGDAFDVGIDALRFGTGCP